jgi:aryl-alcohol dehydrogenase-like predicted oxidoreductase
MYRNPGDAKVIDRVHDVAEARGVPAAQVALAWMLSKPWITAPIVGASKPGHLDDAIAALSLRLDDDEIKRLEEVYEPHIVLGHS